MENGERQAEVSGTLSHGPQCARPHPGHASSARVRTIRRLLSPVSSRRCPACLRLFAAAVLLQSCWAAAAIYKWKDPNGGVHYGDHPPPGVTARTLTVDQPPAPDPDAAARRDRRNRLLEIYSEDRQRREARREAARKKQEKRSRNCAQVRQRLAAVRNARFLYEDSGDPNNPRVLSSKERARETQKLVQQVQAWCD